MLLNTCRKVVVIDDQIEEALPLMKMLSKNGATTLYYSGKIEEMPAEPLEGVRLVFCDLKFSVTTGTSSVVSNIIAILKKIISEQNGPYILLIWSTHQNDYMEDLQKSLSGEKIAPEFILSLEKADYFDTKETLAGIQDEIYLELENAGLDSVDEKKVKNIVEKVLMSNNSIVHVAHADALQEITDKLMTELMKAQLFYLFVLWEGTIGNSAMLTVNAMYSEMKDFPNDKKLRAMFYYLAKNRLEQRFEEATPETKFWAAIDSLNDLFPYFYMDSVHMLSAKTFDIDTIKHLDGADEISPSKFNRWKIISKASGDKKPGNVFYDTNNTFEPHGLVKKKRISGDDTYEKLAKRILTNEVKYLLLDVSSECDIAQDKIYVSRVVPGIMITKEHFLEIKDILGEPDYIYKFPVIEIEAREYYLIFNLNQMSYLRADELYRLERAFSFTEQYWIDIKQKAAQCVLKHGIERFDR